MDSAKIAGEGFTPMPGQPGIVSLLELLQRAKRLDPGAIALAAPGRLPQSFGDLLDHIAAAAEELRARGLSRGDRVVLALPNGPEMAAAFLAVSAAAVCAPLNPAYGPRELDFYLGDLEAAAVIVPAGAAVPAADVARQRGIPVLELAADSAAVGHYSLAGGRRAGLGEGAAARPDDVALLLHTSGTTSRPKIVPLTHANLCASARHVQATLGLAPADRCLNVMPLFHIHGLVAGLLASLAAGASVACLPGLDAVAFYSWLEELRPTWYTAVPTMHQGILARASGQEDLLARCPLRFIRSSSAALPLPVLAELERVFAAPVIESYGMTEAAHQMASNPLPPGRRKPGSVGLAAGPEVAVLDEHGRQLPAGDRGEVAIRGPNVTAGYQDNPDANRQAFAGTWLRTGDQGYLDDEGYLFLTGRLKELINRGGEKIAPREVEDVLLEHHAVAQAVAFAAPDDRVGEAVAAAVVLRGQQAATERELQAYVGERLAYFKVPRRVVFVDQLPKGATGKVQRLGMADRLGLKNLEQPASAEPTPYTAPHTPQEQALAAVWAEVLGLERVGIHDNFFVLGGDSLLAARVSGRARAALGAEISLAAFFAAPTVAQQAAELAIGACPPQPIQRLAGDGPHPASFAQRWLWILDRLLPDSPLYNEHRALELVGPLDAGELQAALTALVARQQALRTTFHLVGDVPVQAIAPARPVTLQQVDLAAMAEDDRQAELERQLRLAVDRPFDLSGDLLLRAVLIRLAPRSHVLLLVSHHIAVDGWSWEILMQELADLYRHAPLAELPIRVADFAAWEQQQAAACGQQELIAYWRERLAGAPDALELPADRPRPARQRFRGATRTRRLPPALAAEIQALGRDAGTTLFMTLLAAFQTLLHRYTGREDVLVGAPTAGRRVETEGLIGCFINTLVLRGDLGGDPTFRQLLARVREACLQDFAHQDLPFERLVASLQPRSDVSRTPLAQVHFQLRNVPERPARFADLQVTERARPGDRAKCDLTLEVSSQPDGGLLCACDFDTDLFDGERIARMLGHFQQLLAGIVADPEQRLSRLPLLSDAEHHQVVVDWNGTAADYPADVTVNALFERQAALTPDAPAVIGEGQSLTYRQLNERANLLAHHLQRLRVAPDVLVGLCVARSPEMVVGMLAILKAGGAYLPLDVDYPQERLALMLADSGAAVLLTLQEFRAAMPPFAGPVVCLDAAQPAWAGAAEVNPTSLAAAGHLACVIYTSGSTGRPKGVALPHRGICRLLFGVDYVQLDASQTILHLSSSTFDAATFEIWGALLHGARCVLHPERIPTAGELRRTIARHGVSVLFLTTSLFNNLIDEDPEACSGVRQLMFGGEAASPAHVRRARMLAPASRLINCYGPTEVTTFACCDDIPPDAGASGAPVPIGRPIGNTRAYVLDRRLRPVPVGVPGELFLAGDGLARGYLNRPALTAEHFLPDPFGASGQRMYRTGDRVRWRPDGKIEFLGRLDDQLKLRGFRIEPAEIEAALAAHPAVRQAAVVTREDRTGHMQLVAYVVPAAEVTAAALRQHLQARLPAHMVPAAFVTLAAIPRTAHGKADRRALPPPDDPGLELARAPVAPAQDPLELRLVQIWEELLGVKPIGIHDDFFELGGHSLAAISLFARIERELGYRLPVSHLFEAPTVAQLAASLGQAATGAPDSGLVAVQPRGTRPPFFCVDCLRPVAIRFITLAEHLGPDQPFYALQSPGREQTDVPFSTLEALAAHYIQQMQAIQPEGPYYLGGLCRGSLVAYEMACQLRARGIAVGLLAIFDQTALNARRDQPWQLRHYHNYLRNLAQRWPVYWQRSRSEKLAGIQTRLRRLQRRAGKALHLAATEPPQIDLNGYLNVALATESEIAYIRQQARLYEAFQLSPYPGRLTLLRTLAQALDWGHDWELGWGWLAGDGVTVKVLPGLHPAIMEEPNVQVLARHLLASLDEAQADGLPEEAQ